MALHYVWTTMCANNVEPPFRVELTDCGQTLSLYIHTQCLCHNQVYSQGVKGWVLSMVVQSHLDLASPVECEWAPSSVSTVFYTKWRVKSKRNSIGKKLRI